MRTIKIFLLVFVLSITSYTQWLWRNPNPQANGLLDSYFIDDMNGWAVGYYGACIKTTDAGETWKNIQVPIHTHFESVHFIDYNKGFIGDWSGNLLTTTDGGNNWTIQHFDNYSHIHVFFVNELYGWLLSSDGTEKIYRTTDGGESWEANLLNTSRYMLDIFFIDSTKGFVAGGSGDILMTTDGGVNWNYVNSPTTNFLYKITFKDPLNGFIVGSNGTILKTTDGGIFWEYSVVGQYTHSDISFFGQNKGIMVGAENFLTGTGGLTWAQISIYQNGFMTCTYFTETNCIVMSTSGGDIYKSSSSGANWESKVYGDRNTVSDIIFLDSMTGLTVGSEGTILKTFDGGNSWHKSGQITNEKLTSISFSDNVHGWIVGTNSVFLKSVNGGIGWTIDTIPDCDNLFAVDFVNNNVGLVAGYYSKISKTTDSGETWMLQPINFSHTIDFSSLFMVNDNTGYACGIYRSYFPTIGIIFKTTNGGTNWDSLFVINTEFKSIFFKDSLNGWAVGTGTTIQTTDGGITWNNVSIGGGNDIFFATNMKGIKVSNDALGSDITITTDGGNTWVQQTRISDPYLYAAYIVDNNYWVAGMYGTILFCNNPIVTNIDLDTDKDEHPTEFRLYQNYPNPFNPVTKIKYTIPKVETRHGSSLYVVMLKIYDILGTEIVILVNEEKSAGEYEVEFNGSRLPSGIYFYQLKVGTYTETKKMVLIK